MAAAKVDQIRRLLADGYVLEEVESGSVTMEARFRKGARTVTVRFLPSEAEALLMAGPLRFSA